MKRKLFKSKLQTALIIFSIFIFPSLSLSETSVNVNLDSWVYPALERLTLVGLTESDLMNTKPLTRIEAARLTGEAMRLIAEKKLKDETDRLTLYFLERLKRELKDELISLGIIEGTRFDTFIKPLEELRVKYNLLDGNYTLYNNDGIRYGDDHNLSLDFSGYGKLSESLSLYYQPIFEYNQNLDNETRNEFDLEKGYVKLTKNNLEFELGRDSLWWGPGYHGSLLMTNNAKPFDMLKISNPQPILLPWFFRYMGPFKVTWFLTRLEEDRTIPEPYLTGLRLDFKPIPTVELGISRVVMFGGEGRERLEFFDYISMFLANQENKSDSGKNNNQIASIDFSVRIPHIDRFVPISRSIIIYGEIGGEDEAGWLFSGTGYLTGILLQDIFLKEGTTLRIEYANNDIGNTPNLWYNHNIYKTGYTYKNSVIGHHMGSDAQDIFIRGTSYLNNDLSIGIDIDIEKRGNSNAYPEEHYQVGIDLSYNITDMVEFKGRYGFERIENFGFVNDETKNHHIMGFEVLFRF
ncbi:MAG: capsule assembly Wzi family protein [Thermodesulfobacteriota bacterium]